MKTRISIKSLKFSKSLMAFKTLTTIAIAAMMTVSCLDETVPTGVITEEQKQAAAQTMPALLQALPARLHAAGNSYGDFGFGYGAMMHIRDLQTGDMCEAENGYQHFAPWERNLNMGANSLHMQYIWNYYYQSINACNQLLSSLPADTTCQTNVEKAATAAACAFRALFYLDLARSYEFLPNDVFTDSVNTEGNRIAWLTVPIIDEHSNEESARYTPRATRDEMFRFIRSDLQKAEALIGCLDDLYTGNPTLPHLYSVKGLQARMYMWVEDYDSAYIAAVDAQKIATNKENTVTLPYMAESGTFYSIDEAGSLYMGFNDPSAFMWADVQTSDDATVMSGICNWTSWMCPLTSYGYAGQGAISCIDMSLYNEIPKTDYRRKFFVMNIDGLPDGTSIKFAPGGFDFNTPSISAAAPYPIMRLEEMAFIECEAAAQLSPRAGKAVLESFMKRYVDETYTYKGEMTKEGIINEIIKQKRIELWGEGQVFFDIKRLNMSVTRGYKNTNFSPLTRFNTNGRPAWMNWVIVLSEENSNASVRGMNNPDPSGCYQPWVEQ